MIGHDEATRLARIVLALRDKRSAHLPADLLGEQAWGILLAMFVADAESEGLTAAEVCARAGGSPSTAIRWLYALEQYGLVDCEAACEGRQMVALTPTGISAIEACMDDAQQWMVSKSTAIGAFDHFGGAGVVDVDGEPTN